MEPDERRVVDLWCAECGVSYAEATVPFVVSEETEVCLTCHTALAKG